MEVVKDYKFINIKYAYFYSDYYRDYIFMRIFDLVNSIVFNKPIDVFSYEIYRISEKIAPSEYVEKVFFPLISDVIETQKSFLEIEIFLLKNKQNDLLKSTNFQLMNEEGFCLNEIQKQKFVMEILIIFINTYINKHNREEVVKELKFDLREFMNLTNDKGNQMYLIKIKFFEFLNYLNSEKDKEIISFYFFFILRNLSINVKHFEYEFYVFDEYFNRNSSTFFDVFLDYSLFIQNTINYCKTLKIEDIVIVIYEDSRIMSQIIEKKLYKFIIEYYSKLNEKPSSKVLFLKFDTIIIKLFGKFSHFSSKIHEVLMRKSLITNKLKHIFIVIDKFSDLEYDKLSKENNSGEIFSSYSSFFINIIDFLNNEIDVLKYVEVYINGFNSYKKYYNEILKYFEKFLYIFMSIDRDSQENFYRNFVFVDEDDNKIRDNKLEFNYIRSLKKFRNYGLINILIYENKILNKVYFLQLFTNKYTNKLILGKFNEINDCIEFLKKFDKSWFESLEFLKIYLKTNRGINDQTIQSFYDMNWTKKLRKLLIIFDKQIEESCIDYSNLFRKNIKLNNEKVFIVKLKNYLKYQISRSKILDFLEMSNEIEVSPYINLKEAFYDRLILKNYKDFPIIHCIAFCFHRKIMIKNERMKKMKLSSEKIPKIDIRQVLILIEKFLRKTGLYYLEKRNANKIYKFISANIG